MSKEIQVSKKFEDRQFLLEALKEAKNSRVVQSSNQKIGSIIVKNGKIVGRGFRETMVLQENPYKDMTIHAEHKAITEAGNKTKGATIYNTLEPCFKRSVLPGAWHPPSPCCQLIYEAGIKKVVFVKQDENFGGGGSEYLLKRGVEVFMVEMDDKEFENLINLKIWRDDVAKLDEGKTFLEAE
jgi:diaminohydroxyphosphoribosylaminopyrimidine deaminase/5-amino-6-(5-phosphoribosylamino)uracil reductase